MIKQQKKIIAGILIFSLIFSNLLYSVNANAAEKKYGKSLFVSSKNITLKVGESKKIEYKVKVVGTASKRIMVKAKSNIISTAVKGNKIVIKGKREGTAKLTVITKAKNKSGKKIKTRIMVLVKHKQSSVSVTEDVDVDSMPEEDIEEPDKMEKTEETEEHKTGIPVVGPTAKPTAEPTVKPTAEPTVKPTVEPTAKPTAEPTAKPTVKPTAEPTVKPTTEPTVKPTAEPTVKPTVKPTAESTAKPTVKPTAKPTVNIPVENGTYKINTKVKGNMLLDVCGNSNSNNTNIQIYEDNKSLAQQFNVTHVGNGWYKICGLSSGKALDVAAAEKKSGVNVQLYTYNGSDAQLWQFLSAGDGYYYIQNKLGYYLDVEGGKTANDTNVQVYDKNETNSQKWRLMRVIYPSKVSISPSAVTLTGIGMSKQLSVVLTPSNVTEKNITWSSSNTKVVTVSKGLIKATGSGSATITAKTINGKTANVEVRVSDGAVNIENGLYNITTKLNANMMLDVAGGKTCDGANIQIYQKNGSTAQKFQIESVGYGWYVISNTYPRKCLDVEGGSTKAGTNVSLYQYNGSDAQLWRFYSTGNGYYTVMNKLGCYLDVAGGVAQNDRNVLVYTGNGTNAQKWKLTKTTSDYANISDSLFTFYSKIGDGFVLDVDGGKTADGTNIQIYKGNDSNAQKFGVQPTGDGWFKIYNSSSEKCLDVKNGSGKSGTNVQLFSYNGTDAQKWRFYPSGESNYYLIKNKLGFYLDVDGGKKQNGVNVQIYKKNSSNAQKWQLKETSAIVLNTTSVSFDAAGKTMILFVSYLPARVFAGNQEITWSSSNAKVATVANGVVKAVGTGSATITAKAFNGKTASVAVVVNTAKANSPVVEKAISWAVSIANDNSHGYSQTNRWGPDYDCSSFVISAFKNAGVNVGTATYTGNMRTQFTQHGFQWIPWSQIGGVSKLQRGDVLLNEVQHTEIYLGNNQNVGAHSNRGYSQTGDQTGTEVSVSSYYFHPWDGVLRYVGK